MDDDFEYAKTLRTYLANRTLPIQGGFFLTIEGLDGSGKTGLVEFLAEALCLRDIPVLVFREPGGTPAGESLRQIFKDATCEMDVNTQGMVMFAARNQLLQEKIIPALKAGYVVICDRYVDSTFAMQYRAGGMDGALFEHLSQFALRQATPDLTLYLDIPVEVSQQRCSARGSDVKRDRYEEQDDEYHQAIRDAFLDLNSMLGDSVYRPIDATASVERVQDEAWQIIQERIVRPRTPIRRFSAQWWREKSRSLVTS